MPSVYVSKYKLKMFLYRGRSLLREIVGKRGERKRARIFSIFAVLAIILLVASFSVYGLNLKTGAQGGTQISATTTLTYDGVSIHAKAENITSPANSFLGSATAKRGNNDIIKFTLTVSNASSTATATDVKFTLPSGFTFNSMITTGLPAYTSATDANGLTTLTWSGYSAQAGDSTIVFTATAP